jgi:hypothetical protein
MVLFVGCVSFDRTFDGSSNDVNDATMADMMQPIDTPSIDATDTGADVFHTDARPDAPSTDVHGGDVGIDASPPDTGVSCTSGPISTCAPTEFCATPPGVCFGSGTCAPRPPSCPPTCHTTCGCDGRAYCSECVAQQHGVSISGTTGCLPVGGCLSTADCALSEFCSTPIGACGAQGMCVAHPLSCPILFSPACGCDGVTYMNTCVAARSGVSVRHLGSCP